MTEKIKVLIVCHDSFMSGANRSLFDWLSERDVDLIQPIVLLPKPCQEFENKLRGIECEVWVGWYSVPVRHLERVPFCTLLRDFLKLVYGVFINPLQIRRLAFRARREGVCLVHTNSFATLFGAQVAHRLTVPHVWHIREFCDLDHGFSHWRIFNPDSLCESSHAIFISNIVASHIGEQYKFATKCCITNRVAFDYDYKKSRRYMDKGVCNLLIVGYLSEAKGQSDAIAAVKKLIKQDINVHLYLCGEGNWTEFATRNGVIESDRITFLGYQKDVAKVRSQMDIALICSRMEAFGRVTIEAQYYKNLVIGADSGCTSQLISDGENGFLYPAGDIDALASTIVRCMALDRNMDEWLDRISEGAIRRYSSDISHKIYCCYLECLGVD